MVSIAVILACLGLLVFVATTAAWVGRIKRVAIPSNRTGFLASWLTALLLGVASFYNPGAGWLSGVMATVVVLGSGLFLLLYSLGKQGAGDVINVGDSMPAFTALDENRETFESNTLNGAPILIKFFRGHW
ncbi:MAG: hypothetical protein AB8B81_06685 [Halioglobus sp.]